MKRICSISGCGRPHEGHSFCAAHLLRHKKGQDMLAPIRVRLNRDGQICTADNCGRPVEYGLFCSAHHGRNRTSATYGIDNYALGEMPTTNWWREISYATAHVRVKREWGSASNYPCVDCGKQSRCWGYDGTDPSQLLTSPGYAEAPCAWYSLFPEFYMPLCAKCHSGRDGALRVRELAEYRMMKANMAA